MPEESDIFFVRYLRRSNSKKKAKIFLERKTLQITVRINRIGTKLNFIAQYRIGIGIPLESKKSPLFFTFITN